MRHATPSETGPLSCAELSRHPSLLLVSTLAKFRHEIKRFLLQSSLPSHVLLANGVRCDIAAFCPFSLLLTVQQNIPCVNRLICIQASEWGVGLFMLPVSWVVPPTVPRITESYRLIKSCNAYRVKTRNYVHTLLHCWMRTCFKTTSTTTNIVYILMFLCYENELNCECKACNKLLNLKLNLT